MGAAASSTINANGIAVELSDEQQIQKMLNTFENYDPLATITKEELALAESGWTCVVNDLSPEYIRMKKANEPNLPHSCLSWFYDSFFLIAMEYDENIKESYNNNMKIQIRAMVSMISATLSILRGNEVSRTNALFKIAKVHCQRGILSHQYSIVANVCVKTFVLCMGETWKDKLQLVWTKAFSIVLTQLIPSAYRFEKKLLNTNISEGNINMLSRSNSDITEKIRMDTDNNVRRTSIDSIQPRLIASVSEILEICEKDTNEFVA